MSSRRFCILVAVLAALPACASATQAAGKRYALLVGVREYDHAELSELKYTENDVEELATVLRGSGYAEVIVLTTTRGKRAAAHRPTAGNIRARLQRLSDKVTKNDLLLVGLSGHGLLWPVLDPATRKPTDESFFCPCDARPRSQQTLAELEKTMIPLGELFRRLDESGAGVRLMLVDACRNAPRSSRKNVDVDNLPRTKKGTAVLFSCKSGEFANETDKLGKGHGVFFYHVIEALKSEPRLTWSRLADRVIDKVTEDVPALIGGGASQTPHEMRNIVGRSPLLLDRVVPAATASEVAGWFAKGCDYFYGRGVKKDQGEALKWFRQAADRGHTGAMNFLGCQYAGGHGVAMDAREGVRWYRRAADRGDAGAMYNLAVMYQDGHGVNRDRTQVVKWARQAAAKGHPGAMTWLGVLHEHGQDVAKDRAAALAWYRKAAALGYEDAKKALDRLESGK